MTRTVLVVLAVSAASLQGQSQQQQADPKIMVGHPISRIPAQPPPTLPLRAPVYGRPVNQPQQTRQTKYVPAPLPYYPYGYYPGYPQPQQSNVNVNVTNVIETPPAVTMIAPVMMAPAYNANQRRWDPEVDIAESRAAEIRDAEARRAEVDPSDVKSPEAIVGALYDVISGPRGTSRNWERFKGLFADGAHLIATRADGSGPARPAVMTVDEYASIAAPALEEGVYQREVSRSIQQYGAIAHVFSTYECRKTTSDVQPFQRGINSIQLLNDGQRWWIMSVSWDSERPGMPIPAKYLPVAPNTKKQ